MKQRRREWSINLEWTIRWLINWGMETKPGMIFGETTSFAIFFVIFLGFFSTNFSVSQKFVSVFWDSKKNLGIGSVKNTRTVPFNLTPKKQNLQLWKRKKNILIFLFSRKKEFQDFFFLFCLNPIKMQLLLLEHIGSVLLVLN